MSNKSNDPRVHNTGVDDNHGGTFVLDNDLAPQPQQHQSHVLVSSSSHLSDSLENNTSAINPSSRSSSSSNSSDSYFDETEDIHDPDYVLSQLLFMGFEDELCMMAVAESIVEIKQLSADAANHPNSNSTPPSLMDTAMTFVLNHDKTHSSSLAISNSHLASGQLSLPRVRSFTYSPPRSPQPQPRPSAHAQPSKGILKAHSKASSSSSSAFVNLGKSWLTGISSTLKHMSGNNSSGSHKSLSPSSPSLKKASPALLKRNHASIPPSNIFVTAEQNPSTSSDNLANPTFVISDGSSSAESLTALHRSNSNVLHHPSARKVVRFSYPPAAIDPVPRKSRKKHESNKEEVSPSAADTSPTLSSTDDVYDNSDENPSDNDGYDADHDPVVYHNINSGLSSSFNQTITEKVPSDINILINTSHGNQMPPTVSLSSALKKYRDKCIQYGVSPIGKIISQFERNISKSKTFINIDLSNITVDKYGILPFCELLSLDFGLEKLVLETCSLDETNLNLILKSLLGVDRVQWLSLANNKKLSSFNSAKYISGFINKVYVNCRSFFFFFLAN